MKTMKHILMTVLAVSGLAYMASAEIILHETFDTDGTIDDYTGPGKIFHSYVTNNSPIAVVADGYLEMGLLSNVDGEIYAVIDFGEAKTLLSMQVEYNALQLSAATSAWTMYFGIFPDENFNPGWHVHQGARNWAFAGASTADAFSFRAYDGVNVWHTVGGYSQGTTYTLSLFFNESGESANFTGPDGEAFTLDTACWSFFVDQTVIGHNLVKGTGGSSPYLRGVVMHANRNFGGGTSRNALESVLVRDDLKLYQSTRTTLITIQ